MRIEFEYRDALSNWEWRKQKCDVESLEMAEQIYGLGIDCEYRNLREVKANVE